MVERVATDDAALVALAAGGSEVAFRSLYRAYVRPVYARFGLVGDPADAEDVTQETFLVAWRKLPGLELAGDSLLPWLVTSAGSRPPIAYDAGARPRTHHASPTMRCRRRSTWAASRGWRERPDPARGRRARRAGPGIFRLCAAEGYAYQAAADELGVGHGVVRNRLSRIRTRLRTDVKGST